VSALGLTGGHWIIGPGGVHRWTGPRPVDTPPGGYGPASHNPPCGTEAGYQRHRHLWRRHRQGIWPLPADDPCGCRDAHRQHRHVRIARKQLEEAS
jgi:hypothetical protein